ncbi:hypothetical protein DYQ86_14020 [Acidobacteria bacterium AB60]|nr:hypothetical protein DYQ86_14020 [Acidobacteria bacterium AB60]
MRQLGWGAAVALAFGFVSLAAAQPTQWTCTPNAVINLNSRYNFQMNKNNSPLEECATIKGSGFTIATANFNNATNGPPAAYTSIYRGCHWGSCTISNPFPIQESNLASAMSSVRFTQPPGYNNNAAYDIWFNRTSEATSQPNGAEVMIWLNHQGVIQPFGARVGTIAVNGARYDVWTGDQSSWKIVSYVAVSPVTSATSLNLTPFFQDAVARHSLDPSWWVIDVEFGFEIWTGGRGLGVSDFSVNVTKRY